MRTLSPVNTPAFGIDEIGLIVRSSITYRHDVKDAHDEDSLLQREIEEKSSELTIVGVEVLVKS